MWEYGISSLLELLKEHLPGSLDYMLQFFHISYQMTVLVYETVPVFQIIWKKHLASLPRYKVAIDKHYPDCENWSAIAVAYQ